ncbi:nitrogenase iron-molybdenum cofactor biosynthesis protein NifE [Methylocystis heyeri]|uniref:Nitrogenase iron-molybdenum cofactor biosynthesis protein NifE n=1 Tax=Methylocystis heyeri TaxID=391905 RepID=A0A6B8KCV8_9HYPH|nr:nitrogenase iron-molybdenum cofactor biosynthesis protein NifE [Methylocystis heyeri]QGM44280.1 nitrogenase iron-molybdenum cofactor biosynthesis protein NifE [Methylocystis heyeri]
MKPEEIQALMDEPACAHNKKSKSGCAKPAPGATQGGCCFDGARNALLPVADVAHIVHGPIGCAGSSWDNRGTRSSGPDTYRIGMTTDLSDMDVIMGRGERRLYRAIRQAVETHKPAAVFVYNTCVPALQGDDIDAVSKAASERFGVPVVPVDCAGFYGNKNLGNRIAGDAAYKHMIGGREPEAPPTASEIPGVTRHDINLIGEWNVGGEFWNVSPLFDELGLRVLCSFSGDSRFHEIQTMHRAEASMVVCSKAMLHVARKLEADHGIPWFEGSFYGVKDTSAALRGFARLLNDSDLTMRVEALIAREEARVEAALDPPRQKLRGKRVLIFTGGYKSWSVVSAMQDLGMVVVATGTEKSTEEDKARIRELMGPDARMISDNDQTGLIGVYRECGADILIAGDRYIYPTLKSRIPFLDIDHVRRIGYAGYDGLIELARNLDHAVHSPVWNLVRSRPSWSEPRPARAVA